MKRSFDKIVCSFDPYPMLKKKLFILIATITLVQGIARAQQFPVQVTPQLLPPYSVKVSDYYSPGAAGTKLNLLLLLRDFNKPQLQVRLRMSIEGQSVAIRTREDAVFTPVTIESGTPFYIDPSDLAQYFNPNNLDFSGITRQQYEQTGKLPEGFYTFCFEAIEVTTNQSVSNKGCAFGWLTLNEPPILNIPRKAETVAFDELNPQNLIFQWTPRHTASPTAAFNTEYVISIVLLDDDDISPEAAFIMRTPFFTETVTTTTVSYSPAALGLTGGEKYAWRVQAVAKEGGQDLASFRNQGYSETFWFTYGNNCAAPTGATASPQGQRVSIEWTSNPAHLEYKVEYREVDNPDAVWFEIGNTLPRVSITDLKPGITYQYRVGGACEYGRYTFGNLSEFTTNDSNATTVPNCGIDPNLTDPSQTLLSALNAGTIIHAGDYDVMVTHVAPATGQSFSGEGYVKMSWLGDARVAVRFTNIDVNTEYKLASGIIETTYDPNEEGIADVDAIIGDFTGGYDVGRVVSGVDTADHVVNYEIQWPGGITTTPGTGYDPQTGLGPVTINLDPVGTGPTQTISVNELPVTIKDKEGNIYQVNKDGTATSLGKSGGEQFFNTTNRTHVDTDKAVVVFKNYPEKQVYAFDEWKEVYKESGSFNKKYERLNNDYYVSAKAIAPGKTDYLKAIVRLTDNTLNVSNIQFINSKGTIYNKTQLNDSTFEISVVGGPESDAQEIYALYPRQGAKTLNLGKILVASYPRKDFTVKMIPVDGATVNIQSIQEILNAIYGKLNIGFTLSADENYTDLSWDADGDGLDVKGSGAFSSLTAEMKNLIKAYSKSRSVDKNTLYLFVLNNAADSTVIGDMPRGQQFGFLFNENNSQKEVTVAHEIAHGLFRLKHVFDGYGFSSTDLPENVMSYPAGNQLSKYQWDLIFDAGFSLGFFDSDADNELAVVNADEIPAKFKNPGTETYSFYDPLGNIITLPANVKNVAFSTGDMYVRAGIVVDPNRIAMVGSMVTFVDAQDNKWIHNVITTNGQQQVAYLNTTTGTVFTQNPAYNSISKVPIIGRPCFINEKFKFQIVNVINLSDIQIANPQTFQNVDLLSNYFVTNYARSEYINATMGDLSEAEQAYVIRNIKNASPDKPYATYIFGLGSLINQFPKLHDLCNGASDEGFEQYKALLETSVANQQEREQYLLEYYKGYFDLYLKYQNENKADVLALIRSGCDLDPNAVYSHFVQKGSCVGIRIRALADLKCVLNDLVWDTERKMLLDIMYDHLDGINFHDYAASSSLVDLCDKTPLEQNDQLLQYFQQNSFQKLINTYGLLDSDQDKEQFTQVLTGILVNKYKAQKDASFGAQVDPLTLTPTERQNTINIPIWNTSVLEECSGALNLGDACSSLTASLNESTGEMTLKFARKVSGVTVIEWVCKGNPYTTWVNLHVKEDFNYAGLKSGQVITVPLFYAYHMAKQHRSMLNSQTLRIAINTAAILGAVFTGGSSLSALAITDVALSSVDIVVTINQDKLHNSQFLKYWDKIQLVIGGIQLFGSTNLGRQLNFSISESKLASLAKNEFNTLRKAVGDLLVEAKVQFGQLIDQARVTALKLNFETQLLKYEIGKYWKDNVANTLLIRNFNQLNIKLPNLNNSFKLAEYRYVDNDVRYYFNEGKGRWVDDITEIEANVANGKLRKVGEIENAPYYVSAEKQGEGTLEIYQDVKSPNVIYLTQKVSTGVIQATERFIANTGTELKSYLSALVDKPLGKTYSGNLYKSVNKQSESLYNAKPDVISEYSIEEAWGRYDTQGESAMYYSETMDGNQIEMSHYGEWNSYSTYEYGSIHVDNVLDLTNGEIRQQLGTEFDKLVIGVSDKSTAYEFTNVLGTWAREKGYKGLIVPGARGNKDYTNVIIFNQSELNIVFEGITPKKLK